MASKSNVLVFKIFFLLIYFLVACTKQKTESRRDIRDYFLPLAALKGEGLVYEYQAVGNDSLPPVFWHHKLLETDSGVYVISDHYDLNKHEPTQRVVEEIVENGVRLKEYYFFNYDNNQKQRTEKATIKTANVFPFSVGANSGFLVTELTFRDFENEELLMAHVRNKQFEKDTTVEYDGQMIECVKFFNKELIEYQYPQGEQFSYNGKKIELFGKHIGLLYYQQHIGSHTFLTYRLAAQHPASAFFQ